MSRCRRAGCDAVRGPLVGRVADRPSGNDRHRGGATGRPRGDDAETIAGWGPCGWSPEIEINAPIDRQPFKLYNCPLGCFSRRPPRSDCSSWFRLQLERLRISSPVTDIYVSATLTAPLEPAGQMTLFDQVRGGTRRVPSPHTACADYNSHWWNGWAAGWGVRRSLGCGCGRRPSRNCPGITIPYSAGCGGGSTPHGTAACGVVCTRGAAPQVVAAAAAAIVAAAAVVGGHVDRARRAAVAFPPRQP